MADQRDAQLRQLFDGEIDDGVHVVDAAGVEVLQVPGHFDRVQPLFDASEIREIRGVGGQGIG